MASSKRKNIFLKTLIKTTLQKNAFGKSVIKAEVMGTKPAFLNKWKYLSANPRTTSGDGSFSNPFDASTREKFDALMLGMGENESIYLFAGTYQTRGRQYSVSRNGDWYPKSGWHVKGEGIRKTVIKMDWSNNYDVQDEMYGIFYHYGTETTSDMTFEDFTMDMNFQSVNQSYELTCCAMGLRGFNIIAKHLEVINLGTNSSTIEGWGICLNSTWDTTNPSFQYTGDANIIDNCILHSCAYPYLTTAGGISFLQVAGNATPSKASWIKNPVIRNCIVDASSGGYFISNSKDCTNIGIHMSMCVNGLVENNVVRNCKIAGPYADTSPTESITIRNNYLINCLQGIVYRCGAEHVILKNTTGNLINIHDNLIYSCRKVNTSFARPILLSQNLTDVNAGEFPPTNLITWRNVIIKNNLFFWESGQDTFSTAGGNPIIQVEHASGLIIQDNYADMPGNWGTLQAGVYLTGCRNFFLRNNNMSFWICDSGGSIVTQSTGNYIPYEGS